MMAALARAFARSAWSGTHRAQVISMRCMPCDSSVVISTASLKHLSKAGQPQPDLNLAAALYSGWPASQEVGDR